MPNYNSQLQSNNTDLQMVLQTLQNKAAGGDGYDEVDSLIMRTIRSYTNSRVSSIGDYAFYFYSSLATVSLPVCTSIGGSAFTNCYSLTTVSFPACTTISNTAFGNCHRLATASFPACTTIGFFAFNACRSLATVSFPVCTTIGSYAFDACHSLTTVSFPACTTIGGSAFQYCRLLSQLYLTSPSFCKLLNSNAFASTPYAGYSSYFSGTPYIYVPASLLTSYQTATNWTYFSSYFSAIEDAT